MPATTIEIRAQDKTKRAFSAVQRSVSGLSKSFGSLKGSIAGLLGVAALGGLSKSLLTTADRIDKVSQQTGVATDDLQKFQFAASQSGVSTEGLNKSLQTLAKRSGEVVMEGGEFEKVFNNLGISLTDADGKTRDLTDIFYQAVSAISKLESQAEKAAAANDLFGRSGVELLPLLNQGEARVRKYGDSLEKAGGIMSSTFVTGAAKTNDAIDKTTRVLKVGFSSILEALLPMIQGFAKTLVEFSKNFKALAETHPTVTKLALAVTALSIAFAALGGPITAIVTATALLIMNWERLTSLFEVFETKVMKMGLKQLREEQDRLNKSLVNWDETVKTLEVPWYLSGAREKDWLKAQKKEMNDQLVIINKQIKALETKKDKTKETSEILEEEKKKLWFITYTYRGIETTLRGITQEQAEIVDYVIEQAKRGDEFNAILRQQHSDLEEERRNQRGAAIEYLKFLDQRHKQGKADIKQIEDQTEALKEQRAESARIAGIVLSGIRSSGSAADRFFSALNIQIKKVGDSFKLVFEKNWVAIIAKFAMSSKKIMGIADKVFSAFGNMIDNLFSFLGDMSNDWLERGRKITQLTDEWNRGIVDVADNIIHFTNNERALNQIRSEYHKNLAEATELNSDYLVQMAKIKKDIGLLAYSVNILRSATQSFANTAEIFLQAVAMEGFGAVQKQMFLLLDQFTQGPMKNYNIAMTEAQEILKKEPDKGLVSVGSLMSIASKSVASYIRMHYFTSGHLKEYESFKEKLEDVFFTLQPVFKQFTGIDKLSLENIDKFYEMVGTQLGAATLNKIKGQLDPLIANVLAEEESQKTLTEMPGQLEETRKGLLILLKDILKTSFEGGKTQSELIRDAEALSKNFKDVGINIKDLTDYINTLTPKALGGSVSARGAYLVGEKGPELFSPSRSGWITPNHQLASGGHNDVVVNIYDGTGQKISAYDSSIRVEINERASRYNEFSAMAA